jgi:hypothetical protein
MSGYVRRQAAINAAGRATFSYVQPQFGFIWHARGQGFESSKLNIFPVKRHVSIIEMIFDLLHAGKRMFPPTPRFLARKSSQLTPRAAGRDRKKSR